MGRISTADLRPWSIRQCALHEPFSDRGVGQLLLVYFSAPSGALEYYNLAKYRKVEEVDRCRCGLPFHSSAG
jgi:hypothetical protein